MRVETTQYHIRNYRARLQIGCADDEQGVEQEVVFDVRIDVVPGDDLFDDRRDMPYDYLEALAILEEACGRRHWILQESLAHEVARRILAHPRVCRVEIDTCKTERYAGTEGVGFHLVLARDAT